MSRIINHLQDYAPPAPEGMRMFVSTMLKYDLSGQEVETMVKTNPAKLLGLPRVAY